MEHHVEYCFLCDEYTCRIFEHAADSDSFITHINQLSDMAKIKQIGIEAYTKIQDEKVKLLHQLLSDYNSGREKTLFYLAVNLLEIDDVKYVLKKAFEFSHSSESTMKERAAYVSSLLRRIAAHKGIELKLRKK